MNPTTKQLQIVSAVLAAVILSVAAWLVLRRPADSGADAPPTIAMENAVSPQSAVAVGVDTAAVRDLVMRLTASGLTRAVREFAIVARVGGSVVKLAAEEGTFVREGRLLLQLDDREYALNLAEARDKLLGAQAEFGLLLQDEARNQSAKLAVKGGNGAASTTDSSGNRAMHALEQLRKKLSSGEISQEAFTKKKLEVETQQIFSGAKRRQLMAHKSGLTQAAIAVQRAELNLAYTKITAPVSGFVADLQVEEGQQVNAGQTCCTLLDLSQIDVEVQVLESEIGLIAEGRKAEVTLPAYPGETFHGTVVHINPKVDVESKTVRVTVRLDNPDSRILPGMFVYAELEAQIFPNRLLVPKDAIVIRDQRKLLFIVRDGLAKWCYVETGLENEDYVEILSSTFGLKPGEVVITSGHFTLVHDARVRF